VQGIGVAVSSAHVVSAAPSCSGGGLLTLFPCSSVRSLSRETVLHKLLQCVSFPWAAALHELPQHGSLPQGAVLQEQAAPAWVPHGVTSPANKPAPAWAPLSIGPQVLAGACPSTGSPWGHSFLQASTCFGVGSLPWATGGYLLHHGPPMDCRGTTCLTMVFSTSCKGRISAPTSRAPPPPSFFTDLGVCRVVSFTSSHSSLYTAVSSLFFFLPFLKYIITQALPPLLIGLALASSGCVFEPAGTGFIRHGGSFWQLLTEATPVVPPLPKPCHANP